MLDATPISPLTISFAESAADFDAAREMAEAFRLWLWETFPAYRPAFRVYFEPGAWAATLNDLPCLHARPGGGILLAHRAGRPVAMVMYHSAGPGLAQVKRMYVRDAERGRGTGRALVGALLLAMRRDGYRRARLDTGVFMGPAQNLYRSMGFEPCAPYLDLPDHLAGDLVYYDRAL